MEKIKQPYAVKFTGKSLDKFMKQTQLNPDPRYDDEYISGEMNYPPDMGILRVKERMAIVQKETAYDYDPP